jgi:hypothetical protein
MGNLNHVNDLTFATYYTKPAKTQRLTVFEERFLVPVSTRFSANTSGTYRICQNEFQTAVNDFANQSLAFLLSLAL